MESMLVPSMLAPTCLPALPPRKASPTFQQVFADSFTQQVRADRSAKDAAFEFQALLGLWHLVDNDLGCCIKIATESLVRPCSACSGIVSEP